MGDFLSRLSERTLGMAPVVRPAPASMFAPEPTSHAAGLEWEGETPTPSGDWYRYEVLSSLTGSLWPSTRRLLALPRWHSSL